MTTVKAVTSGNVGEFSSVFTVDGNTIYATHYNDNGSQVWIAKSTNGGQPPWANFEVDMNTANTARTSVVVLPTCVLIAYDDDGVVQTARSPDGEPLYDYVPIDVLDSPREVSLGVDSSGRVFASYQKTNLITGDGLRISWSEDDGATWATPITVDAFGNQRDTGRGSSISALGLHRVYVTYRNEDDRNIEFAIGKLD